MKRGVATLESLFTSIEDGDLEGVTRLLPNLSSEVREESAQKRLARAFSSAAEKGHSSIVKYFLNAEKTHRLLSQHDLGCALNEAAENGHLNIVKDLLNSGLSIENSQKAYALYVAFSKGHTHIIEYLFKIVAPQEPERVLQAAANEGYFDYVKDLLTPENKILPDAIEKALRNASQCGHLNIVVYLLNVAGEKISADGKACSLIEAFEKGHAHIVEHLFSFAHEMPESLITTAIKRGYSDLFKRLLATKEYKISPQVLEKARYGHFNIICALLAQRPELRVGEWKEFWASYQASQLAKTLALYQEKMGIKIPAELVGSIAYFAPAVQALEDKMPKSLIRTAIHSGDADLVKRLLTILDQKKYDVSPEYKKQVLEKAARYGHFNIVRELLVHWPELKVGEWKRFLASYETSQLVKTLALYQEKYQEKMGIQIPAELVGSIAYFTPAMQALTVKERVRHMKMQPTLVPLAYTIPDNVKEELEKFNEEELTTLVSTLLKTGEKRELTNINTNRTGVYLVFKNAKDKQNAIKLIKENHPKDYRESGHPNSIEVYNELKKKIGCPAPH